MRIAFVHDYLTQSGGAERVLEALQDLWPEAPTYTLLYNKSGLHGAFEQKNIRTSFLQKLPFAKSHPRWYLPIMPIATEAYDLSEFDVILSSASAFSKGIIPGENSLHICYCHTPTRYLWSDTHRYLAELPIPKLIKKLLPFLLGHLRNWDRLAANRVDFFIANSQTVARRIDRYYRRSSDVIYPPVDTDHFSISDNPKDYFLIGGRLVSYKCYELVVEAFTKTGLPLKVFGSGPQEKYLKSIAGNNIQFLGRVSDSERAELFQDCIAFLHPQIEDFGITPVEAMACGRPVIAFRQGGAIETVIDSETGIFFDEQSWEEIAAVTLNFDKTKFDPKIIRAHSEKFSRNIFQKQIHDYVMNKWNDHAQKTLGIL